MDNVRGSFLMVIAMLAFAIEDMFIKQMTDALPVGQILAIIGLGGGLTCILFATLRKEPTFSRALLHPAIFGRAACEMIGSVAFVTALSLIDLSVASAILQAAPLVVTAGAAMFLGEAVGWRRWLAIAVGFVGVLLILRPGLAGFEVNTLWAVLGVLCLGTRDLLTRLIPAAIKTAQISSTSFLALVPAGLVAMVFAGDSYVAPNSTDTLRLVASISIGVVAYFAVVQATRIGDVAVVSPFRYSRMVFALIVGMIAFGERPDLLTLLGAAIIIVSGIFSLWREARLRRASPLDKAAL